MTRTTNDRLKGAAMERVRKPAKIAGKIDKALWFKAEAVARFEGLSGAGDVVADLARLGIDERFSRLPKTLRDRALGRIERAAVK